MLYLSCVRDCSDCYMPKRKAQSSRGASGKRGKTSSQQHVEDEQDVARSPGSPPFCEEIADVMLTVLRARRHGATC